MLAGEAAERGRTPVLIIDEAHLLDHDQLESVRMLTFLPYAGTAIMPAVAREALATAFTHVRRAA